MTIRETLQDRFEEVEAYLEMLRALNESVQRGRLRFEGSSHDITAQQQRVLFSSVYLQLYNLVEATITKCTEAVEKAVLSGARHFPRDLTAQMLKAWVRHKTLEEQEPNVEKRIERALSICHALLNGNPIAEFRVARGGRGNWDRKKIEEIADQLGIKIVLKKETDLLVKRHVRDDLGPLELIKKLRNDLAHGTISFGECAQNDSVENLDNLKMITFAYLEEVIQRFDDYVSRREFIGSKATGVAS